MAKKVKAKVELPGYCKAGEDGTIIEEYKEAKTKHRMRVVKFKKGGYGIFGDLAFTNFLTVVK